MHAALLATRWEQATLAFLDASFFSLLARTPFGACVARERPRTGSRVRARLMVLVWIVLTVMAGSAIAKPSSSSNAVRPNSWAFSTRLSAAQEEAVVRKFIELDVCFGQSRKTCGFKQSWIHKVDFNFDGLSEYYVDTQGPFLTSSGSSPKALYEIRAYRRDRKLLVRLYEGIGLFTEPVFSLGRHKNGLPKYLFQLDRQGYCAHEFTVFVLDDERFDHYTVDKVYNATLQSERCQFESIPGPEPMPWPAGENSDVAAPTSAPTTETSSRVDPALVPVNPFDTSPTEAPASAAPVSTQTPAASTSPSLNGTPNR